MSIIAPNLSPGRGRWPKDPAKRARRRAQLEAACTYKEAIDDNSGFSRSRGAASKCVSVELSEAERAELLAKYGG